MEAEFVALGVLHDDPELTALGRLALPRGPERLDAVGLFLDAHRPGVTLETLADVHVEVEAVLRGLAFGDLLEEQPRPPPVGVNQRTPSVPLILRDVVRAGEVLPRVEPRRRCLPLVPERLRPEVHEPVHGVRVERDLERRSHPTTLPRAPAEQRRCAHDSRPPRLPPSSSADPANRVNVAKGPPRPR